MDFVGVGCFGSVWFYECFVGVFVGMWVCLLVVWFVGWCGFDAVGCLFVNLCWLSVWFVLLFVFKCW